MFNLRNLRLPFVMAATATLGACNLYTTETAREGIGYREARFAEISAMREYRSCRDDALEMDRKAKTESSAARYIASARLLDKCEAELGPEAAKVGEEERVRAVALSVQNYFKGGDIAKARVNLSKMKKAFPGQDLYFPDGSSFTDTMEVFLGLRDRSAIGELSAANVSSRVKSELRRVRYWKHN
mgnify:CR=1 FL=1|jgi:hypothetical protein